MKVGDRVVIIGGRGRFKDLVGRVVSITHGNRVRVDLGGGDSNTYDVRSLRAAEPEVRKEDGHGRK
jgi:preprotein translocase subunit YajC